MQACPVHHACFLLLLLLLLLVLCFCFGVKLTGMDMVGKIILLVYTGWTQSVRSH